MKSTILQNLKKKLKNFIFPKLKKYIFWIIVLKFFKKRKS